MTPIYAEDDVLRVECLVCHKVMSELDAVQDYDGVWCPECYKATEHEDCVRCECCGEYVAKSKAHDQDQIGLVYLCDDCFALPEPEPFPERKPELYPMNGYEKTARGYRAKP